MRKTCSRRCGCFVYDTSSSKRQWAASLCGKHWRQLCAANAKRQRLDLAARNSRSAEKSDTCRISKCSHGVLRCRASDRQWRERLCGKHWRSHCAKQKRLHAQRLRRQCKSRQQSQRRRRGWDLLRSPQRRGRWKKPQMILVSKLTHFANEGVHLPQQRGGICKRHGTNGEGSVTIMNCQRTARCKLAAEAGQRGSRLRPSDGIYMLFFGALRSRPPGGGRDIPTGHTAGEWRNNAAGLPLAAVRCDELISPGIAAKRWPRRADTGVYKSTLNSKGRIEYETRHRHKRWGDVGRKTRLQPPVVVSKAYRLNPLARPKPKSPCISRLRERIRKKDMRKLPMVVRPRGAAWNNAMQALRDVWTQRSEDV